MGSAASVRAGWGPRKTTSRTRSACWTTPYAGLRHSANRPRERRTGACPGRLGGARRRTPGRHRHLRFPSGNVRRRPAPAHRLPRLADRRRPRRGLQGLGRIAYGRELNGRPAREEMETAYKRIEVAVKNTDIREHDIADSDTASSTAAARWPPSAPCAARPRGVHRRLHSPRDLPVPGHSSGRPPAPSAPAWSTPSGSGSP
jgi:hypothetical protein